MRERIRIVREGGGEYPAIANELRGAAKNVMAAKRRSECDVHGITEDLESLEKHLAAVDDQVFHLLQNTAPELSQQIRRESQIQLRLRHCREKMTDRQFAIVEQQYLHKRLVEKFGVHRVSLYYLVSTPTVKVH